MHFNIFNSPVISDLIQALNWTLIHSLWQGLLLAIITGIILLSTPKSKPTLRYNLLTGLMLLFMICGCFTFYIEFKSAKQSDTAITSLVEIVGGGSVVSADKGFVNQEITTGLLHKAMDFCSQNASLIVFLWLTVFISKSIQAVTGLWYINKLRHDKVYPVDQYWQDRFNILVARLKVSSEVVLMESEMISIPTVIGFIKPFILVPIGFLGSIPHDQVEAILLHELAHIRRQDFLVNLFQNFAESIYFFNPAVLWISYLIRQEREHCCDDLAIGVMQNRNMYVNALVGFQERKLNEYREAMAFASKRNLLLDRIKRIIYKNNKQLDAMEKLFVTASLLTVTTLFAAFSQDMPKPPKPPVPPKMARMEPLIPPVPEEPAEPASPPVPPSGTECNSNTIHITKDDKRYEIEEVDGEIEALKINGMVVSAKEIGKYEAEVQKIIEEVTEVHLVNKQKRDDLANQGEAFRKQAEEFRKQAELMRMDVDKHSASIELSRESIENKRKEIEKSQDRLEKQDNDKFSMDKESLRKQAEQLRLAALDLRKEALKLNDEAKVYQKDAEVMRKNAEVLKKEGEKMRVAYEKLQANLVSDLQKEGVIKDGKDLSFKLSDSEFIVNGVKQSDKIHSQFKKKYLKGEGQDIVQNWKEGNHTFNGYIHRK